MNLPIKPPLPKHSCITASPFLHRFGLDKAVVYLIMTLKGNQLLPQLDLEVHRTTGSCSACMCVLDPFMAQCYYAICCVEWVFRPMWTDLMHCQIPACQKVSSYGAATPLCDQQLSYIDAQKMSAGTGMDASCPRGEPHWASKFDGKSLG